MRPRRWSLISCGATRDRFVDTSGSDTGSRRQREYMNIEESYGEGRKCLNLAVLEVFLLIYVPISYPASVNYNRTL